MACHRNSASFASRRYSSTAKQTAPAKDTRRTSAAILFGLLHGSSQRPASLFDDFQVGREPARGIRADPHLHMTGFHPQMILHIPQGKGIRPKRETHLLALAGSKGNPL